MVMNEMLASNNKSPQEIPNKETPHIIDPIKDPIKEPTEPGNNNPINPNKDEPGSSK